MTKRTALLFIISLCTFITSAQVTTNLYKQSDQKAVDHWVDSIYSTMSLDEKIGQLFMPIVESRNDWKPRIAGYIQNQKVGGLLFSKGTLSQQASITNYAQELSKVPLFISLDGEWGLSMRIQDAPSFPRNMIIGAIQDEKIVELYGSEVARQCKEMGIHINFAPVIDVHSNPANPIIGNRSFGENPDNVSRKGIAYAMGLESNGVISVAKHFPGHGDTSEDSHKTLPVITHNKARIEQFELYPFRKYINAGLSGIMTGHLDVPALNTKGLPASLSPEVGIKLLKEEMGYTGLTFTDGMAMKGVSTQNEASVKAILAGNDIILGVINQKNEFESVKKAVEEGRIPTSMLEEKVRKILTYKFIAGAHKFTPINTSNVRNAVNSSQAEWTQRKIYDGAVTLLKNNNNLVPITDLDKRNIASVTIGAPASNTFQKYLKKYGEVTSYQVQSPADATKIIDLNKHNLIIISIHSDKISDIASLQIPTSSKQIIFVLFTSPYNLSKFSSATDKANAVIVAYDNSEFAQMSVAQGIFGGIRMTGKLPVSSGNFKEGTGIDTEKIRLSYSLPEEVGLKSELFDNIENIALEGIRQRAYPGCQILVAKDGVIIYEREFGKLSYGESPDVTSETVYDLASVTKASATLPAVMKLYDEKKLALQDNLGKFVKETKGSNKENIRIRSLLLHETGIVSFIPYYVTAIDKNSYTGSLFGSRSNTFHAHYAGAWGRTDYKFYPDMISSKASDEFYMPVAENMYASDKMHSALLKEVIDTPLQRVGQYRYSCLNFMLLKETVENISGVDLNNFVQNNFYDKLGSVSTTFQPLKYMSADIIAPTENDPFFRKQHLRGYVHDEGAALFGGISGNAGLFSNANDLAKLYQMWLNKGEYGGERFLSKETVELFTTAKSSISRRGMGFDKPDPRNSKANPTSPGTPIEVFGHTGFTGTCFWVDPTNNMIYIFLSNRVNPARSPDRLSSLEIRERIQEELYQALDNKKNSEISK
ncbi:glycoside hydrolase family 3 N-terminal domain-containing protein [Lascolabacillus sp.]|uniref:glycoside hydrolase family 3 N-terminal domain-containing protein n=1 Tax=Lascolabacillus sp. TaxID=1924068 RepID=UPI00258A8D0E|nr:glycoside hydrolase family 3 N-terminal domain-containing protein [Lascolabacillus sp.]MDD2606712.1 glycoside hydrolase family 3 N-terminal domain-containing protein [Lascolabacillus sp.]MDD4758065.1 glycoside hydrolase family 3 N-terminal domain-containing protein [Lascolabacillus sp.]